MYSYDKKKQIYYFTNDLREYLIKHGVNSAHINGMQRKKLEEDRDSYYDSVAYNTSEYRYYMLVPLDKVIGTSRGDPGRSVYDNVESMKLGAREPTRFESCFEFFNKFPTLNELQKSYETLPHPVEMIHYVEDDVYYVTSDGNHRTLTAMLVGAKRIRARVTDAHCNESKKTKYIKSKGFIDKYNISMIIKSVNMFDILFEDDMGTYIIPGYPVPKYGEDLPQYLERLSHLIDEDIKCSNRIKKMPKLLQLILLILLNRSKNKNRIDMYIDKRYLSSEEVNNYYSKRVKLYLECEWGPSETGA